jgi:hypothetical protein
VITHRLLLRVASLLRVLDVALAHIRRRLSQVPGAAGTYAFVLVVNSVVGPRPVDVRGDAMVVMDDFTVDVFVRPIDSRRLL